MLSATILRAPPFPNAARALKFFIRQTATVVLGTIKLQNHQFRRMTSSGRSANLDEDALLALQARLEKRTIQNPSQRTPDRDTHRNKADRLEKALKEAGFQTWGFVIYRCTYRSDSDWAEFLRRYRSRIADSLEHENGLDLLHSLQTTVFENQERYESASTTTIREDFQQWARTAVQEEQDVSPDMLRFANIEAARYRFCLFVNEESLQSVLQAPLEDFNNDDAFVNMLNGWWKPESLEDYTPEEIEEFGSDKGGLIGDGYEPIEGCTVRDVGWMKVSFFDAGLLGFLRMGEHGTWETVYECPSDICYGISGYVPRRAVIWGRGRERD